MISATFSYFPLLVNIMRDCARSWVNIRKVTFSTKALRLQGKSRPTFTVFHSSEHHVTTHCFRNDFLFQNFVLFVNDFQLEMIFLQMISIWKSFLVNDLLLEKRHFLLFFAVKSHLHVWEIISFRFGND